MLPCANMQSMQPHMKRRIMTSGNYFMDCLLSLTLLGHRFLQHRGNLIHHFVKPEYSLPHTKS